MLKIHVQITNHALFSYVASRQINLWKIRHSAEVMTWIGLNETIYGIELLALNVGAVFMWMYFF